jgi:virulence factor Mce-like protein
MASIGRKIGTVLFVVAVAAGTYFGVRARYGHFSDYYYVNVDLPRAGQLLRVGSDVRESGVVIGTVSAIELVDRHVRLTLQIEPQYRVPADAEAFVDLKTLLGDKFVDLRFDDYGGPFLEDGAQVVGHVGPELEDVLQSGTTVLEAINPDDAATIIGTLARAARGHGEDVARGLEANAELSSLFADTLPEQLRSLEDFEIIFVGLQDSAFDLNELADAINEGVPVYASEEAQAELHRSLVAVVFLSDNLADLLIIQREDWDRMIEAGDTVLQTIVQHKAGLEDLVHGLYRYVFKLGGPPPVISDGSEAAPFANFFGGDDFPEEVAQICNALPNDIGDDIPICEEGEF